MRADFLQVPDPVISRAAAMLQRGQPLDVLSMVGSRSDRDSLALAGIALSQLGDFEGARDRLRRAKSQFMKAGSNLELARIQAAIAEIDFATRDFKTAIENLNSSELRTFGDLESAEYIDIQRSRALLYLGDFNAAAELLASVTDTAAKVLAEAELAICHGRYRDGLTVLSGSKERANPLLQGEMARLAAELNREAFTLVRDGAATKLSLVGLETVEIKYVDSLRKTYAQRSLARRDGQLELLSALAHGPVTSTSFFGRQSESLDVRLRMEMSRLRSVHNLAITSTKSGYSAPGLAVLLPRVSPIVAMMADEQSWPSRSLALVLGKSIRSVERDLQDAANIAVCGSGPRRRYRLKGAVPWIATQMLLLSRPAGSVDSARRKWRRHDG